MTWSRTFILIVALVSSTPTWAEEAGQWREVTDRSPSRGELSK